MFINCFPNSYYSINEKFQSPINKTIHSIKKLLNIFSNTKAASQAPTQTVPSKRPLKVEQLHFNSENRNTIYKISSVWDKVADRKWKKVRSTEEAILFSDSCKINNWISELMSDKARDGNLEFRIFLCRDQILNQPQAIAITQDKIFHLDGTSYLYVLYLATNPLNIRAKVNASEPQRTEGAATHLIRHLAKVCLQENQEEIKLISLASAETFYKKLGFEVLAGNYTLKKEKLIALSPSPDC